MPHFPKPFFRPSRGVWHVQLHGRQFNLGREKEAAFVRYHKLMSQPVSAAAPPPQRGDAVVVVIDQFLGWCKSTVSTARTSGTWSDASPLRNRFRWS